jgi:hypothetical protein
MQEVSSSSLNVRVFYMTSGEINMDAARAVHGLTGKERNTPSRPSHDRDCLPQQEIILIIECLDYGDYPAQVVASISNTPTMKQNG